MIVIPPCALNLGEEFHPNAQPTWFVFQSSTSVGTFLGMLSFLSFPVRHVFCVFVAGIIVFALGGILEGTAQLVSTGIPPSEEPATIIGTVTVDGVPQEGASVQLLMSSLARRELQVRLTADPTTPRIEEGPFAGFVNMEDVGVVAPVTTDESGRFRFTGVPAGEYHLLVDEPGFAITYAGEVPAERQWVEPVIAVFGGTTSEYRIDLVADGTISGGVFDESGRPIPDLRVAALAYQYVRGRRVLTQYRPVALPEPITATGDASRASDEATDDSGRYSLSGLPAGEYYLVANPDSIGDASPLYYPGTTDPATAVPITIAQGADVTGINFQWRPSPLVPLRGRIQGPPPDSEIYLVLADPDGQPVVSESIRPNPPGDFELMAPPNRAYELFAVTGGGPTSGFWRDEYYGMTPVIAGDRPVENILVTLNPPVPFDARVVWESVPPANFEGWQGSAVGLTYDLPIGRGGLSFFLPDDGSFDNDSFGPLPHRIATTALPTGTYVESARYGRTDPLIDGFDPSLDPGSVLELRIGNQAAQVSGTVRPGGAVFPNAVVTLVPDGDRRGRLDLLQTESTDPQGNFAFETVAPGTYLLFAWDSIPDGAIESEVFRLPFESQATRIIADRLETINVDTTLIER